MSSKPVVVITGANTGLGYEVVKALAQSSTGYDIVVGSRDTKKGEDAIEWVKAEVPSTASSFVALQIDVESDESIEKLVSEVSSRFGHVDALVNNGGVNLDAAIASGQLTKRQAWNKSWDVNVSGTMVITEAFVPLLLKSPSARLLFIASGTSSLTETELREGPMYSRLNGVAEAGWPKTNAFMTTSYRSTKAGLNMAMREWNRVLANDPIKVFAVSPGFLATNLGGLGAERLRQMGAIDPSIGGNFVKDVIEGKRDHDEGKVIRKDSVQGW